MRLEHNGTGRPTKPARLDHCRLQDGLVPAVHAIEIADCQHGATGRGGDVFNTMEDSHGWEASLKML